MIKTKKCQSNAGDRPDLIQTAPVPSIGLARQYKNKQNEKNQNQNQIYFSDVTLAEVNKLTKKAVFIFHPDDKWITDVLIKTKKCQPAVRDTLDNGPHPCGVGVGVPDGGLTRPQNKNKPNEKSKNSQIKLLFACYSSCQSQAHTKRFSKSQVSTKTKKCQPAVRDTLDNGPHPCGVGVGVPDGGLARLKTNYLSHVTLAVKGQNSTVTVLRSQLSGHGAAVTALRSRLSGHGTAVIAIPSTKYSSPPSLSHCMSRKMRNKLVKQVNGNGKNSLLISHWNLGSKKWTNKRNQIQALVDTDNPDAIFISEANLDELTPPHETIISGYDITLPKTVTRNDTARLVLLTKENLEFELMDNLMDDIVSSIWIKISRQGVKGLLVCGIYREHQYLNQVSDWSLQPAEQSRRWSQFLRQVETARISSICHLIGDFNLDYKKWNAPDFAHLQMITDTKDALEAGGFFQLIDDVTRTWPGQVDSLIDHFWTNEPQKILKVSNVVRAVADHNVISACIRIKGSDTKRLDTRKRSYKFFDPVLYRHKLEEENWSEIYEIADVDIANDFLESRIVKILDEMCPYRTIQYRTECKTWLADDTKEKMKSRDAMRELARTTNDPDTWQNYRSLRNEVNLQVNSDRKKHYDDIYERHHLNNDVGATYRTAKNQVGWSKNSSPVSFVQDGKKITDPQ